MEGCFGAQYVRPKLFPFLFFEAHGYTAFNNMKKIDTHRESSF
ncbi:hypothetical protein T479_00365 [Lysinibacillus varians]|nr:hypothetical protein T479_00365 [Lysinibacillus varians]